MKDGGSNYKKYESGITECFPEKMVTHVRVYFDNGSLEFSILRIHETLLCWSSKDIYKPPKLNGFSCHGRQG